MKTCPNCGELNGDTNNKCYKCGNDISNISEVKQYCTYCKGIYASRVKECPRCGIPTVDYDPFTMSTSNNSNNYTDTWMYIIGFLIPIVGIILGCIQVGKGDKTGGRNLIITAIISAVLYSIVSFMVINHNSKKMEEELNSIYETYDDEYDYYDYWD